MEKNEIISLFFNNGLNTVEIANKIGITKQYVSKVVRKDPRYLNERERRKELNKEKQKQRVKEYIYKKREIARQERIDETLALQHAQASFELSSRRKMNNPTFKKWNSSIYDYDNKNREFRISKSFENKTSYAIPKKIRWD